MREIVHIQAGQCGNQIGAKVSSCFLTFRTCQNLLVHELIKFGQFS